MLGDGEACLRALEGFAVFLTLAIAGDLAFESMVSCRRSTYVMLLEDRLPYYRREISEMTSGGRD